MQRESTEAQERNRIIESENKKRADDIAKLEKDISNTERKIQTLKQLPSADEVTAQLLQANLNLLRAYKGNLERRKKTPVLEPVPLPITPAKDGTTFMFTFEVEGENGHRMEVSVEPGDIQSLNRALLSSMEAQTMMLGLGAPLISRIIRKGIAKGASALPKFVLDSYKGRIREITLAQETQLPRLFGGTSSQLGRTEGIYLTTKSGIRGTKSEIINGLALPPGNTLDKISWITLPAGTKIYVGRVKTYSFEANGQKFIRDGGRILLFIDNKTGLKVGPELPFP